MGKVDKSGVRHQFYRTVNLLFILDTQHTCMYTRTNHKFNVNNALSMYIHFLRLTPLHYNNYGI